MPGMAIVIISFREFGYFSFRSELIKIIIRLAKTNLTPADQKGGESCRPILMAIQVEPQIRQSSVNIRKTISGRNKRRAPSLVNPNMGQWHFGRP